MLSLSLGLGASAAIFTVVDTLVLPKLPVEGADDLVLVTAGNRRYWNYAMWQLQTGRGEARARSCSGSVSGEFFAGLGVRPVLGRAITLDDDQPGGGPDGAVVVIGHRWSGSGSSSSGCRS